jgi:HEAT repeat protein
VRALVERGADVRRFLKADQPAAVRLEAIAGLTDPADLPRLLQLLTDTDPFLRNAAVQRMARSPKLLAAVSPPSLRDPGQRVGMLLAWRAADLPQGRRLVRDFLSDPDEDVRFLAAKWIADLKLAEYRPQIAEAVKGRQLPFRLFFACTAALARLDGHNGSVADLADYFFDRLRDNHSPTALRVLALQMIPASYSKLTPKWLGSLLTGGDATLQLEAVRALEEKTGPQRIPLLWQTALNQKVPDTVRAQALLGVARKRRTGWTPYSKWSGAPPQCCGMRRFVP